MPPFVSRGNRIALASEEALLLVDISTGISKHVALPRNPDPKIQNNHKNQITAKTEGQDAWKDGCTHISTGAGLALSHCSTYVAACTSDKCLTLWKTENLQLVHQWEVPRKISSIFFTHNGDQILIADKAGDCYVYSYSPPSEKGKLVLGHLSMLLDVVVSDDDSYIITSERDEKIRVSCFPNAYNIHTYCLGHTEFVTSIALLRSNCLLSGSGDASIRLWDFVKGKELHSVTVRSSSEDEMENAVRSVSVHAISESRNIAAVILNRCRKVLAYIINEAGQEHKFECQELLLDCFPLATAFTSDGSLYILSDDSESPIKYFTLSEDFRYTPNMETAELGLFHENSDNLKIAQDCAKSCNGDLKPLYKRWFDNMQAYREQKEKRLGKNNSSEIPPDAKKVRTD